MFLTEPPCKALILYLPCRSASDLRSVAKIRDAEGIRVGQILRSLKQNADDALSCWGDEVEDLQWEIEKSYWIGLTTLKGKRGASSFEAYPKFIIFLEPDDDASTSLAKRTFSCDEEIDQRR